MRARDVNNSLEYTGNSLAGDISGSSVRSGLGESGAGNFQERLEFRNVGKTCAHPSSCLRLVLRACSLGNFPLCARE